MRKSTKMGLDDSRLDWLNRLRGDGAKEYQPVTRAGKWFQLNRGGFPRFQDATAGIAQEIAQDDWANGHSLHSPWYSNRPKGELP